MKATCKTCNQLKVVGAEIRSGSGVFGICESCRRKDGPKPPRVRRQPRFHEFEIVSLSRDDGCWHIRRKTSVHTICQRVGKSNRYVKQDAYRLLLLRDDPACCPVCRKRIEGMFAEGR